VELIRQDLEFTRGVNPSGFYSPVRVWNLPVEFTRGVNPSGFYSPVRVWNLPVAQHPYGNGFI
jgi:hypothetical protein